MAKLKIVTLELVADKLKKQELLESLQAFGAVELTEPSPSECTVSYSAEEEARLKQDLQLVQNAVQIAGRLNGQKKSLLSFLEPRKTISAGEYSRLLTKTQEIVEKASQTVALQQQSESLASQKIRLQTQLDILKPWCGCDIPLCCGYTRKTAYLVGSVRKKTDRREILSYLAQCFPTEDCLDAEVHYADEEITCFTVFCLKEYCEEVEQALRDFGFVRVPDYGQKTAAQASEELKAGIQANEKELSDCLSRLKELSALFTDFCLQEDILAVRLYQTQGLKNVGETHSTCYIKGYIAQRDAKKITAMLRTKFHAAVLISEPDENEEVPVLLTNNAFSAPVEGITGMYSLPSKADIDPTGVMAFFYYFFFGMMFSDAGYGMLMVLACGGLLLWKRNMESKMKNTLRMYLFCGISTAFWGAVYGSWFGDAPAVICREFLNIPDYTGFFTGLVNPTDELMRVMVLCFVFGLVHLFTGVILKGVTDIKNGKKADALFDTVPSVLMVLGLAPIFFHLFIQDSMYTPDNPGVFDTVFNGLMDGVDALSKVSAYLLIAGIVLVILTGGRDSKSIGGKIAGGLYAVYNVFGGYLGDVLSYARLLALGLATGIVAQVMNMLGSMFGSGAVKAIAFAVIFTIGHVANFAINVIGAYVHTNRLQYVEFFGKFYEGGGRAFVPFSAETKYMKLKEEN